MPPPPAHAHRVVVYLQTLQNLDELPDCFESLTTINLASFHFGFNADGTPYVHLNDDEPGAAKFASTLWPLMKRAQQAGVKVMAMLGGAGGAYRKLFASYATFYPLWCEVLRRYAFDGVDLDVEERVAQADLSRLIADLRRDFPRNFFITAAPVANALIYGIDPLSGLRWRLLAPSLDWFNVQFYSGFGSLYTTHDYDAIVAAGFAPEQIVAGLLTNRANGSGYVDIALVARTITLLAIKYPDRLGGAMGWEFFNANGVNEGVDPMGWAVAMKGAMTYLWDGCGVTRSES